MNILEDLNRLGREQKTPLERGQAQEGSVVGFLTLAQLQMYGPLAVREWLKRRPAAKGRDAEPIPLHQQAWPSDGGGS